MKKICLLIVIAFELGIHSLCAAQETRALESKKSVLLFLGDSLTEGYGVDEKSAYPVLVGESLKKKGHAVEVLNGSVSGSTTASGLSRLRWFLKRHPTHLFLALGANDGLRGLKVADSKKHLESIIELAQKNQMKVILAGMLMPPNYGESYRAEFKAMYDNLAKVYKLDFIPFLLKGVAGKSELNIEDGVHPNEAGHRIIAELVTTKLEEVL